MSTLESKNVTVRAVFCLIFMHFLALYILKGQFHIFSCQRYGFFENRDSVHLGVNPPQKHHPLFLPSPLLNPKTVEAPRFLDNPPYVLVFREPPLPPPKTQIF